MVKADIFLSYLTGNKTMTVDLYGNRINSQYHYSSYTAKKNNSLNMTVTQIDNLRKLDTFLELSFHEIKFKQSFVDDIKEIILTLKHQPEVFPTMTGNIQFEYERKTGEYLEIEINSYKEYKIFKIDCLGHEYEGKWKKINLNDIKEEVERFYD